jgi:2,4-dienoyl-CoA reductase-like NADH-dependent reductase (Old Yellow Enzyme family)
LCCQKEFVLPEGKAFFPGIMGIHTDDFAKDYENLASAVHDADGTVAIQLAHGGGQSNSTYAGRQPLAPSAVKVDQFQEMPAELTKDQPLLRGLEGQRPGALTGSNCTAPMAS